MRYIAAIAGLFALLLASGPATAQIGLGFGIGTDPFGGRHENIRIGAVARGHLEAWLASEYKRICKDKKETPPICAEQRPYYKSAFLPERGQPLPAEISQKVGFVYPGTEYRQIGFSVYLVGLPTRRIHDVVSVWSDGWK